MEELNLADVLTCFSCCDGFEFRYAVHIYHGLSNDEEMKVILIILLCTAMEDFAVKTMTDMMLGRCRCAVVEVLVDDFFGCVGGCWLLAEIRILADVSSTGRGGKVWSFFA
eukprot:scaffold6468_cov132-Chaetoceros_neogracile.AAC.1